MTRSLLLLCGGVLLGACAMFPQPLPETQTEFVPTGEVQLRANGAAFDAVRIRKPNGNLSKRTDGSWGGVLAGQAIDVSVTPKRISGVNLTLVLEESGGEKGTIITGQFQGNILRFEIGPEQAVIRTTNHSMTLQRSGPGAYGARGEFELKGEASLPEPPWPQFALAMLVAFTD